MALTAFRVNILSLSQLMYDVSFVIGKIPLVDSMSVQKNTAVTKCTKNMLVKQKILPAE